PKVIHSQSGSRYRDGKHGIASPNYAYPFYQLLRAKQDSLSALFAYGSIWGLNIVAREQADISEGELVSGSFFRDLGVVPAAGRLIVDEDDRAGALPVAVLSYKYWQKRYLSDPAAVGQSIRINHIPVTIAGVTAPGFFGVNPAADPAVYLPLRSAPVFAPKPADDEQRRFIDRNSYWVEMMGRLRPGVSLEQAQVELAGRFHQYVESTISSPKEKVDLPTLWLEPGAGGLDSLRRQYSEPLYILMAMVGLILAIACANIANLLLARATSRRREMAIRLSLGAGRGRVIGQLLTESIMLSLAGAILGLLVALWGIRSITWLLADGTEDFTLHASLSWPVLAFAFALALVTGILFGLAPALQATGVDLTSGLKETKAGTSRGRRRFGLSQVLVAGQVAISLLLVIAAGLFVRTISNLHSVDLGFNRENVLIFEMNARQAGYKGAALAKVYHDLLDRFDRIPGVRSAGLSRSPLATGNWNSTDLRIPGASQKDNQTCVEPVDPSFLATLQIPLVAGRAINQHDMESPR
ncbi:MAG: ABC transporter permease, partial [Bryobacteraceae bacterium]